MRLIFDVDRDRRIIEYPTITTASVARPIPTQTHSFSQIVGPGTKMPCCGVRKDVSTGASFTGSSGAGCAAGVGRVGARGGSVLAWASCSEEAGGGVGAKLAGEGSVVGGTVGAGA